MDFAATDTFYLRCLHAKWTHTQVPSNPREVIRVPRRRWLKEEIERADHEGERLAALFADEEEG